MPDFIINYVIICLLLNKTQIIKAGKLLSNDILKQFLIMCTIKDFTSI